jgi:hypothetical protein
VDEEVGCRALRISEDRSASDDEGQKQTGEEPDSRDGRMGDDGREAASGRAVYRNNVLRLFTSLGAFPSERLPDVDSFN